MAKSLLLTIPTACHEDWQSMTASDKGRFCMACQKNVVDFTNMSDREILQHITKATGSVCGRMHGDQLNRTMTLQKETRHSWLKYFFQFTLPAFIVSMKAQAQDCPKPTVGKVMVVPQKNTSLLLPEMIVDKDILTIKGRVMAPDSTPVAGASVMVKGTTRGVLTDMNGFFKLLFSDENEVVLIFSSLGFETYEMAAKPARNMEVTDIKVTLLQAELQSEVILVGAICTRSVKPKRSALEIARSIISPDSVRIFPNPIGQGNKIDLELKVNKPGNYYVEVTDFNGRLMLKKEVQANAKVFKSSVSTDQLLAGSYIVCVRNRQGKKIGVKKIIVQ